MEAIEVIKKRVPELKVSVFKGQETINNRVLEESHWSKFQRSIMNQAKEYSLPVPAINLYQNEGTIPFLTLKSFSLWQGKQKSKKTTALALAVAAFISESPDNTATRFTAAIEGVVLFLDCEQGESYAARTMKLILKLAGVENSVKLIYCDLREFSPGERKKIIEAAIEGTPNIKLVVIDGLVDLLNDFMDASEGHLTITDLLKFCSKYNIHIAGVLHQNKNDKNARAHVGTISSQKCEVEITTEVDTKDRAQSIVSCMNSRGMPFEPFAIRWDKGSLPCINQDWNAANEADEKTRRNFERSKETVAALFGPLTSLSHTQSIEAITAATLKSESTAKRILKDWLLWGLIAKGPDGNYRLKNDLGSRVQEGSNEGYEPAL